MLALKQPHRERFLTVRAGLLDAHSLLSDYRRMDAEEWVAATGRPFPVLIRESVERGIVWAVLDLEQPSMPCLVLYGATAGEREGVGIAWAVATNQAARLALALRHALKDGMRRLTAQYPQLEAYSWSENTLHHEWMLRLGWERDEAGDYRMAFPGRFTFFKFTYHTQKEEPEHVC